MANQGANESVPIGAEQAAQEMFASAGRALAAPFDRLRGPAAWLVVLLFAVTLVLWVLGLAATFDPPYLILALDQLFRAVEAFG